MKSVRALWLVWFDHFNQEPLAIEEAACPPVLTESLAQECTCVHRVTAPDRHTAVAQVFPQGSESFSAWLGHA